MNSTTWILVAGSSRALLYAADDGVKAWTLLKEFAHPASRVSEGGLTTGPAGRTHGSATGGARSAMESKTSPKEVQFEHFAHELANALQDGHGRNACSRIVLIAPPHFLGLLRKTISGPVSKRVVAAVDKDYLHLSEEQIRRHLGPSIAAQVEHALQD
jgi:protein required for attachment to host cells